MNISENIQRILTAKRNIKDALIAKGLAVDENTRIDEFPDLIGEIETGGGGITKPEIPDSDPLTFLCVSDTETYASFNNVGTPPSNTYQYKVNDEEWKDYTMGTEIKLGLYDKVAFKGKNTTAPSNSTSNYRQFRMRNGYIEGHGNIQSLMNYNNSLNSYCYKSMFEGCTSLVTAPELPATNLAKYCYTSMFQGCTGLTTAPELPATTLINDCYQGMFRDCTGLTTAPELPATTLADYCYSYMFSGCKSLTTAPELPVTSIRSRCYSYMFQNCSSLTSAPELPATTLADYCYQGMFSGCKSLTTAPELPATTLLSGCYTQLFDGCSKLNYVKALFTTTPSSTYTNNWLSGVSSTGTFVKSPDATWDVTGTSGVPSRWTVEIYQPEPQLEGYSVKLNYNDGTSEIVKYGEYFEDEDGYYVDDSYWWDFKNNNPEKRDNVVSLELSRDLTDYFLNYDKVIDGFIRGSFPITQYIIDGYGNVFDTVVEYNEWDSFDEDEQNDLIEDKTRYENTIYKVLCTSDSAKYIEWMGDSEHNYNMSMLPMLTGFIYSIYYP